ncbi:MAG: PKD domain-containing protein [Planctomycetota bacterium]
MLDLTAQDTLTAVELNRGEGFRFTLRSGEVRELVLEDTDAEVLLTSCADPRVEEPDGGTILRFTCRVRVDGRPMTLERVVCSQASFYEPYVIDGVRIWFDAVQDLFDLVVERHGPCRPTRRARFAVQDATLAICPQEMGPWCPMSENRIDVADCYNGDDPWMGPYLGASAHGGMDINHPRGTPLWAPIDFDDSRYLCRVARGARNNRWWGVRHWPDGSTWVLGTYHLIRLLVPEHRPIRAGTQYAETAGVHVGSHDHTHFYFMIKQRGQIFRLDPWILFWQIFENNRRRGNPRSPTVMDRDRETVADIVPVGPARTGQPVTFSPVGSRAGHGASELTHWWTFGDGGCSVGEEPTHVFTRPGVYPVTLIVDDDRGGRASRTQHVAVSGEAVEKRALGLFAPDEPSFRRRPVRMTDTYGESPVVPHRLEFTVHAATGHVPRPRAVALHGVTPGGLESGSLRISSVDLRGGQPRSVFPDARPSASKFDLETVDGPDGTILRIVPRTARFSPGRSEHILTVTCDGLLNSPQALRVVVNVIGPPPKRPVTIGDRDPGFYATPGFWVAPRFNHWEPAGEGGRYLTNGGRAGEDQFARFTPDLRAGRYEVSFSDRTPFGDDARFAVRVRHADGDAMVWCEPADSLVIGTFDFREGTDGFVEIRTAGSTGQVLADAVTFRPL